MTTIECPSCAMDVDASADECPICGYEFPEQSGGLKLMAWIMIILMILWLIL